MTETNGSEAPRGQNQHRVLNDRYRVESLIGRGGMADVYLGHDLSLDRQVAVKMLRPDLARDPQFQTRFRREAQSSASLNHHNIVGVYDTGRAEVEDSHHDKVKSPYIVMEYVDGVTLRHIMHGTPRQADTGEMDGEETVAVPSGETQPPSSSTTDSDVLALGEEGEDSSSHGPAAEVGGPLRSKIDEALGKPISEPEAAGYMSGILGALSYSHTKGIVHRDIKPSNVMVCADGEVKVMDFGIARALADSASTMTQTSTVVGTAQYLSPEQARGEVVDHRSDLYSAGCVLFELLTNRPPFQGESPVSVAYQHVREEPPQVSEFNPRVSPAMESVVAKALAKNPSARFQTAEEFDQALQDSLRGIPVDDAPTAAIAAVGGRRQFDDVVAGAAGVGAPLSARTPEDPDLYEEYEQEPAPGRRRRSLAWLWVLILIALVAGGAWALARMLDTQELEIPEVEGLERSEAIEALEDAGITPEEIQDIPHQEVEADHAVDTDPETGTTVGPEEEVVLYISAGPDDVVIPDGLQGESEESVREILEDLSLEVGEVSEEDHPTVGEGDLIATDPEGGDSVELGSEVDLLLSTGMAPVPDVALLPEEEARAVLEDAGFDVAVSTVDWTTEEYDEGTVGGTIYNSSLVEPGAPIPQGATVSISIATAPEDDSDDEDDEEDSDSGPDDDEDDDDEEEDPDEEEDEDSDSNGDEDSDSEGNNDDSDDSSDSEDEDSNGDDDENGNGDDS